LYKRMTIVHVGAAGVRFSAHACRSKTIPRWQRIRKRSLTPPAGGQDKGAVTDPDTGCKTTNVAPERVSNCANGGDIEMG
jgi:hypothetical protein